MKKVVLVSSILTDAGTWGQLDSAGYKITNAFGQVLEAKLVAEKYLRASGLDWTIVRPGGLKGDPPTGALFVSGENTLSSLSKTRPVWPASAAQAAGWPRLAGAWGSLRQPGACSGAERNLQLAEG